jgi:hypothetical protein
MIDIKKRVNRNQQLKYKQYGYHSSGQTKDSKLDFETIMASLNKINTDLISLSITVEKLKHNPTVSHGTLGELRDFLNHTIEAKKQLKTISFQSFLPSELDQVKVVYGTIEQFLESINAYVDFDLNKEKQTQIDVKAEMEQKKREFEVIKKSKPKNAMEKEKRQKDMEFLGDEISGAQEALRLIQDNIDFDGNLSTSSVFKLYSANIMDLKMLIESKLLRNENIVKDLAKTIGGSCCWRDHHQGTEYI